MPIALLPERVSISVEAAKHSQQFLTLYSQSQPPGTQRLGVRCFHWSKAAVAAAVVGRTNRTATSVSHWSEAGGAVRHHHADRPASLTLNTYAVRRGVRLPPVQKRANHFDELVFVDRAAAQFEVNPHMIRNWRRLAQGADVGGCGVNDRDKLLDVFEIPQRLDASRGGTCADAYQKL